MADDSRGSVFRIFRGTSTEDRRPLTGIRFNGQVEYQYLDAAAYGAPFLYWIEETSRAGELRWHGPVAATSDSPVQLAIRAPFPNPASDGVTIRFLVPAALSGAETQPVSITAFDLMGRRVCHILESALPPGDHAISWNLRGDEGLRVTAGLYFLRIESGREVRVRKLTVLEAR